MTRLCLIAWQALTNSVRPAEADVAKRRPTA
jgi:hypothetical protein